MAESPRPPFRRIGHMQPPRPVILAVPHAGRDYPPALLANAAVSRGRLEMLEDRHADLLVASAGCPALVALHPRAWIDLNRGERELDPAMLEAGAHRGAWLLSAKARAGLGLVPHRIGASDLIRRRLKAEEVEARLEADHRPYHAALASLISQARARFGVAILLDCHSMPPLAGEAGRRPARIVIGDRYGRSAGSRFVDRITALAESAGLPFAQNSPYSGGYTLERHGRPQDNVHAIQIEVDRSLYLDARLREPGPGMPDMQAFLARVVAALSEEASIAPAVMAAE